MSATETVSVLMTDLVGSTAMADRVGPEAAEGLRLEHFGLLRGPLVRRRLSALRGELRDGNLAPVAAALGVLEIVASEGLRPVEDGASTKAQIALTPERVRLACFQVIHG